MHTYIHTHILCIYWALLSLPSLFRMTQFPRISIPTLVPSHFSPSHLCLDPVQVLIFVYMYALSLHSYRINTIINIICVLIYDLATPIMLAFPFERPMFMREYSTGTYSATAYFLAKVSNITVMYIYFCIKFVQTSKFSQYIHNT